MPLVWLAALAARFLTAGLLRWLAFKVVAFVLVTVVLPIVLTNVLHKVMQISMTLATEQAGAAGALTSHPATWTGLIGWLALTLKLPEVVAVLIGATAFRAAMSFIPGRR